MPTVTRTATRRWVLLLQLTVPILASRAAHAAPLRTVYMGQLLVAVQGPTEDVSRTTSALRTSTAAFDGAAPVSVLFDTKAMSGDECPNPTALTATAPQINRVLALPTTTPGGLSRRSPSDASDAAHARLC